MKSLRRISSTESAQQTETPSLKSGSANGNAAASNAAASNAAASNAAPPSGSVAQSTGGAGNGQDATAEPKRRDRSYTTGEMARLSNNTLRTVRFYEEAGILRPLGRTEGGHRLFDPSELERLMLVSDMREAGMSLEEIRHLLETKQQAASGQDAARSAIESLRTSMDELKRKVDVLTRLHLDLAQTVESASRCLDCQHPDQFPSNCSDCETVVGNQPSPRAMRVLWSLSSPVRAVKNGLANGPGPVASLSDRDRKNLAPR